MRGRLLVVSGVSVEYGGSAVESGAGKSEGPLRTLPASRISWDPRKRECIPIVRIDGSYGKVTLVAAFREADDLIEVAGSTPGETVALLEYLLAICYAFKAQPESSSRWAEEMDSGRSFAELADGLEQCCETEGGGDCEHWDLFHPTAPSVRTLSWPLTSTNTVPARRSS